MVLVMKKIRIPKITPNEDDRNEYSYSEEFDLNTNRPLSIGVRGPYEFIVRDEKTYVVSSKYKEKFINGEKEEIGVIATKENIDRLMRQASEDYRQISNIYNPFEKFDIEHFINTIMSIDLKDAESILNFYDTYGPIGMDDTASSSHIRAYGTNTNTKYESLDFFETKINTLKRCIQLFEAIQNKDEKLLSEFEFAPTHDYVTGNNIDEKVPKKTLAMRFLLQAINIHSDLMNPIVFLSPEGDLMKGISASCLLGVFYLRLYELVTENPKIKICHYCGNYFIPRKVNANFCPPPEANEKSRCARNYDAMVRRIAKWHYEEGLTLEEIQQKLTKPKSRSIKEIQHILDSYNGKLKK
jgi:hypothetical protein